MNLKAIATIAGKYRGSKWMADHTLYPYPVYEAHFADGTVGRVTFWQEVGKVWDVRRCINLAESIYGKTADHGFIEYDKPGEPWLRICDAELIKAELHSRKPAKRGPTAAQLKSLLSRVLEADEAAVREAQELLAA